MIVGHLLRSAISGYAKLITRLRSEVGSRESLIGKRYDNFKLIEKCVINFA
jgi:hypothetical protein